MKILTEENFDTTISKGKVLVCFSSEFCEPCRKLIKVLEEEKIKFYKFTIDKMDNIIDRFDISQIPTLILFSDGKEMNRLIGSKNKKDIYKFLNIH
jgi:thioredoxin 1